MRAQLLHLKGPLRGRTVTYDDPAIDVGSGQDAELRLRDAAVLAASLAPVFPPAGNVAMSSQSGALGLAVDDINNSSILPEGVKLKSVLRL